jgi:phasin
MSKDAKPNFEIPEEMRKFADQSVEQARKAFEAVISTAHQTVTTFEGRAVAAQVGAKDVSTKAMAFAEHNVAASFEFARQLVRARNLEEIMRLQADYMKTQLQTLADQANELGQTATQAAMKSAKPAA